MVKVWRSGAWLVLAAGLALTAQSSMAADIIIAADQWCPYNCDPASERPGIMVEVARRAWEPAGHKVVYRVMPWARALAEADAGAISGAIGAYPEEARTLIYPATPLAMSRNVLAVRADDPWQWRSVTSLEAIALGTIKNYSYGPVLNDYIEANGANPARIQPITGDEPLKVNLRKLLAGRIGATVEDANVLAHELARDPQAAKVKLVEIGDPPQGLFIGLARNQPAGLPSAAVLAQALDRTMAELRQTGEFSRLLARYSLADWGTVPATN